MNHYYLKHLKHLAKIKPYAERYSRLHSLVLILIMLLVIPISSHANENDTNKTKDNSIALQKKNVTGKVVDEAQEPLAGVAVIIANSTKGVLTDLDGLFTIDVEPKDKLIFNYVGMQSIELEVGSRVDFQIQMQSKLDELSEVTVVAYGVQKKESVIGSISTVNPGELKTPSSNLTTALAGNVAGVIAYQRSGEPGQDNADFFVRGITTFGTNTNPLILIDGVELTSTDLARLQPDDIESFSVMKDATATALYGARGANGVILVTTKQGKEGPAKVSFRLETSISEPTRNIELADPITYMQLNNEAILTRNPLGELAYGQSKIDNTILGRNPLMYPANDWQKMLLKNSTTTSRGNLSVTGGGTIAKYYVAASFAHDNGIMKVDKRNNFNNNISNNTYTLRSNINLNLTKSTEMIVRFSGTFDEYKGPLQGGAATYNMIMHSNPVMFPAYFPLTEDTKHVRHIMFGNYNNEYTNPYAETVRGYKDRSRSQVVAQVELKQDLGMLTKGLTVRGMGNVTRLSQFSVARSYNPYYYQVSGYDYETKKMQLLATNEGTEYLGYSEPNGDKATRSTLYFEGVANYSRLFNERHRVGALLVGTLREEKLANTGSLQLSLPSRNIGLSGRATYSLDDKYFAEFNFGYNGSERFSKNERMGFFPSIGAAWYMSNEKFWDNLRSKVSKVKFRASYGLVGNDQIGSEKDRFFYLSEVNMNDANKSAIFGENMSYGLNGITVRRYANPHITWEVAKKKDFALELGLFDKVNIIAEYFTEYREKILMTRSFIPKTMGLQTAQRANVGEASGKGLDISIDYNQNWKKDFWTSARANITYAKSKYEVVEEPQFEEAWRTQVGYSLNQVRGYIAERLFVDDEEARNSPRQEFGGSSYGGGDIKYTDINNDGIINEKDMVALGHPTVPEIVYGFGFSVGYKNMDCSVFFQGTANESFWIDTKKTAPFQGQTQLLKAYADSFWSEENQDIYALWPRLSPILSANNTATSSWFMRNGSFLRLKQAEIGYTFPKAWQHKLRTSNLRLYLSGTNLLLFSKFKLWDVEMAGNGLGYPIQRVFNVGLNIQF